MRANAILPFVKSTTTLFLCLKFLDLIIPPIYGLEKVHGLVNWTRPKDSQTNFESYPSEFPKNEEKGDSRFTAPSKLKTAEAGIRLIALIYVNRASYEV